MRNVCFFVPYPLKVSPSQRFRFEQYFSMLDSAQINYSVFPFFSERAWLILYLKRRILSKTVYFIEGYFHRIIQLLSIGSVDYVFIHREVAPLGPPVFEWIIAKLLQKKIIYDFDDAIWLADKKTNFPFEWLKCRWKARAICKWAHRVSVGNSYLSDFALKYNSNVIINPTTIDTLRQHTPTKRQQKTNTTIGWTGSHSTLKYLQQLECVLQEVERKNPTTCFLVIADRPPHLNLNRLKFKKWNLENEIADLREIDIGLMPLPDNEWTQGKCGFKALQYMALEIATVASPVGVNRKIISHGNNGLLASTPNEWLEAIALLIHNVDLRQKLGEAGRTTVDLHYCVASNTANFLSLFD